MGCFPTPALDGVPLFDIRCFLRWAQGVRGVVSLPRPCAIPQGYLSSNASHLASSASFSPGVRGVLLSPALVNDILSVSCCLRHSTGNRSRGPWGAFPSPALVDYPRLKFAAGLAILESLELAGSFSKPLIALHYKQSLSSLPW